MDVNVILEQIEKINKKKYRFCYIENPDSQYYFAITIKEIEDVWCYDMKIKHILYGRPASEIIKVCTLSDIDSIEEIATDIENYIAGLK